MTSERIGSAVEAILIKKYEPKLRQQIERSTAILSLMSMSKKTASGEEVRLGLELSYQWGVHTGNRVDVQLPTPNSRVIKQAYIRLKRYSSSIAVDQGLLRSAEGGGAFEDELRSIYNSVEATASIDLSRQCYGDGNGVLGVVRVNAGAGANVVIQVDVANYFYDRMNIIFQTGTLNPATNLFTALAFVTAAQIIDVDRNLNTITVANLPLGVTKGTFIFIGESATLNNAPIGFTPDDKAEISGLRYGISRVADYLGVARNGVNAVSAWRGNVYAEQGAPINFAFSEAAMKRADSILRKNVSTRVGATAAPYDCILTTYEGHDAYYNSKISQQTFFSNGNTTQPITLNGGWSAVAFQGVPVIADSLAPYFNIYDNTHPYYTYEGYTLDNGSGFGTPQRFDFMFFIKKENWSFYTWQWLQFDKEAGGGSILYRKQYPTRTQELYADYIGYMDAACTSPRVQLEYIFKA